MTDERAPSKTELLASLRSGGAEVLSTLKTLPPERFEEGRYENGWNARQILAHVASIEWTYPRLIEMARAAVDQPPASGSGASGASGRGASGQSGIDAYNERQVDKRAEAAIADLLDEFETNRAATIKAVEAEDEALFSTPIQSAGGATGPLAGVLHAVAVTHVSGHLRDIVGGEGR
jgi:DinB superfamily